jgi:hypothetical protein
VTSVWQRALAEQEARTLLCLTEALWQKQVVGIAQHYAWAVHHHYDSRRSEPGWPDLVLCGHGRALFVELKTQTGRLRADQRRWLGLLDAAGCEVGLWRPCDLDQVTAALGPRQQRLPRWTS